MMRALTFSSRRFSASTKGPLPSFTPCMLSHVPRGYLDHVFSGHSMQVHELTSTAHVSSWMTKKADSWPLNT